METSYAQSIQGHNMSKTPKEVLQDFLDKRDDARGNMEGQPHSIFFEKMETILKLDS